MRDISIGADPEYFVKLKGKNISAHDLVKGNKSRPFKLKKGAVQADGTAIEFNIEPVNDLSSFHENIDTVLSQIRAMVDEKYQFVFNPVHDYEDEYFKSIPASALELGCEPDYNAYTGRENPPPDVESTFRTGAGHIHIGYGDFPNVLEEKSFLDNRTIAICLDLMVGVPLALMEPVNKRAQLYGGAGAFRPKTYGLEYRTPSNSWVESPEKRQFIFNTIHRMFELLQWGVFSDEEKFAKLGYGRLLGKLCSPNLQFEYAHLYSIDSNLVRARERALQFYKETDFLDPYSQGILSDLYWDARDKDTFAKYKASAKGYEPHAVERYL